MGSSDSGVTLVTGASGLVGGPLCLRLGSQGHRIVRARRHGVGGVAEGSVAWDVRTGRLGPTALPITTVVHLAGESIAGGRWNRRRREAIWSSRVDATAALAQTLAQAPQRPHRFIHASGVGYYGPQGDQALNESSPCGSGFLAELACAWEAAAQPLRDVGVSVVSARLGMVLARDGGALKAMSLPFRLGLGGPLGSGRQGVSWVTRDDAVRALCWLASPATTIEGGPVNVVSPHPVSQADFAESLAMVLRRPALLRAPAWALRMLLGELAEELLLAGQFVVPGALLRAGFRFEDPEIEPALRRLLGRGAIE